MEVLKAGSASVRSGKAGSEVSDLTIGKDRGGTVRSMMTMGPPPTPPPKDDAWER